MSVQSVYLRSTSGIYWGRATKSPEKYGCIGQCPGLHLGMCLLLHTPSHILTLHRSDSQESDGSRPTVTVGLVRDSLLDYSPTLPPLLFPSIGLSWGWRRVVECHARKVLWLTPDWVIVRGEGVGGEGVKRWGDEKWGGGRWRWRGCKSRKATCA